MDPIEFGVFNSRIAAICAEMGAVLRGAAFSPNIKDRLDFSCAIFDAQGDLCAQAAHIPVHLGSMAYAMRDIVKKLSWQAGDVIVVNDPFLGGTHLPDVTLISPVFAGKHSTLVGFVANRAHHANIGATSPGSMPLSDSLEQEGLVIPPTFIVRADQLDEKFLRDFTLATGGENSTSGDFIAQMSANRAGVNRLQTLVNPMGIESYFHALRELNNYGEKIAQITLAQIPAGCYDFEDYLDDDGKSSEPIKIHILLKISNGKVVCDFSQSSSQVRGNLNCPLSVAAAAVYYVFRCLMPDYTPACAGVFKHIELIAPLGSLLNAQRPAAVAAGNVETSTRIVDVVLGALAKAIPNLIPAASHGSMNNIAMGVSNVGGQRPWDYYETIGGGMGAHIDGDGLNGVQTHMTNTLNTPIESLEMHYPLRIRRYAIREHSGGLGEHVGGCGLIREFEFLSPAQVTLLTERRKFSPWGLHGGEDGKKGANYLNGKLLPGKVELATVCGDILCIETSGGGGWGEISDQ